MYERKSSLETIITSLETALETDCLFPALALALTIPDICGKAKYPEIGKVGERYCKWLDDYVGNYEKRGMTNKGNSKYAGMPYLSGKLVYKLRCDFLHSGASNVEGQYNDFDLENFILCLEKKNEFDTYADVSSLGGQPTKSEYYVNIRRLCLLLLWAAKGFLKNESEETINKLETLKIQDFNKELRRLKFASLNAFLSNYKIVSWNCGGKFREKFCEIATLNADIYIIQECEDPESTNSNEYKMWSLNHVWIGKDKNRGLGVFVREGIVLEKLNWESLCLRYFLPIRVNARFDLLGVWTQQPYIEEYYVYQCLNKHRFNNKTIIFGDFNSNKNSMANML